MIVNLSVGGLKFSCGRDTILQLLPADQRTPGQVTGVMIDVQADLQPSVQPRQPFNVTARVIHSERLAQDVYHVGVQFSDIDEAVATYLKAYIEARLAQHPS